MEEPSETDWSREKKLRETVYIYIFTDSINFNIRSGIAPYRTRTRPGADGDDGRGAKRQQNTYAGRPGPETLISLLRFA